MELLRSVHISDPVYRAYGGFSKIFRHFQGSQWVEWSSRLPRVPMCTHVGGPQAHDSYSNRRPSRCVKQDRLTKRCQWTLESRTARCFIQRAKERTHYMKIGVVFSCHQLASIEFSCHVDPFENFHCHQVAEVPWTPWKFSCPRHMTCKGRLVDCLLKKEHICRSGPFWRFGKFGRYLFDCFCPIFLYAGTLSVCGRLFLQLFAFVADSGARR